MRRSQRPLKIHLLVLPFRPNNPYPTNENTVAGSGGDFIWAFAQDFKHEAPFGRVCVGPSASAHTLIDALGGGRVEEVLKECLGAHQKCDIDEPWRVWVVNPIS